MLVKYYILPFVLLMIPNDIAYPSNSQTYMPRPNGPAETFVRADGAFIPFADDFDISTVTTTVRGVGDIGDVKVIDLQCPLNSLIGRQVIAEALSS
uniref:Nal1 C-terminal domain-containing protein n=1 Tax=Arundo donax TaxID=35708 RepID=A0A0A9DX28_ARUDO